MLPVPIRIEDFYTVGKLRSSPRVLRDTIGRLVFASTVVRAKVASVDSGSGDYRIVLEGTVDAEASRNLRG
jgi:hypothetical protein